MKTTSRTTPTRLHQLVMAAILLSLAPVSGPAAGKSQVLFDGKDLAAWRKPTGEWLVAQSVALDPADPGKFTITPGQGVAVNGAGGRAAELVTEAEFSDLEAHVEFCVPKHSNSGVYLMGRYEIQIYDSFGVAQDQYPGIECGGIYPRWVNGQNVDGHAPRVNVSKPAGQWQTFDIVFRAPRFDASGKKIANAQFVKVVHNGVVIHENVELNGPTRSTLWEDEKPTGPLRFQGDHGPVAYRNVRVKALKLK